MANRKDKPADWNLANPVRHVTEDLSDHRVHQHELHVNVENQFYTTALITSHRYLYHFHKHLSLHLPFCKNWMEDVKTKIH